MLENCSQSGLVSQVMQICYVIFAVALAVIGVVAMFCVPYGIFAITRELYRDNKKWKAKEREKCR